jgi:hypothetical protein
MRFASWGGLLFLISSQARAEPMFPDYAVVRSAGYLGMVAAGVEYKLFRKNFFVGGVYGFTPAWAAGVSVHSLAFPVALAPISFEPAARLSVRPYFSAAPLFALSGPFHFLRTSKEPIGYYPPNRVLGSSGIYFGRSYGWVRARVCGRIGFLPHG